MKTEGYQNILV